MDTEDPSRAPTQTPTLSTPNPTKLPTESTGDPTRTPTLIPSDSPTPSPTPGPTNSPTPAPSNAPTPSPTPAPTESPTPSPTNSPTTSPTPAPSNSPTPAPTASPTPAPTNSPTPAPTLSPTPSPTPAPSNSPTPAPTNAPSNSPTPAPTLSPTPAPSDAPTASPTPAPTFSPTPAPTNAPTMSPTTCDYYNDNYTVTFNYTDLQLGFVSDSLQTIQAEVNTFLGLEKTCNNVNGCKYKCDRVAACLTTVFHLTKNSINMECSERLSCFGVNIIQNGTENMDTNVDIICNSLQSCQLMIIKLQYMNNFYLKCNGPDSCSQIDITLKNVTNAVISCYNKDVCASLKITTDTPLNTILFLYETSNSIIVDNGFGYEPNVNFFCNRDQKLIKLTQNSDAETILALIKSEYINTVNIPCDGVRFECTGGSFCIMKIIPFALNDLSTDITQWNDNCLYISAEDISELQCDNDNEELQCLSSPTPPPTSSPTPSPSNMPTLPTYIPTVNPTFNPSVSPTPEPTLGPTKSPTKNPTLNPTHNPTLSPTPSPTLAPTLSPTPAPSDSPTPVPTNSPTLAPTSAPSSSPTPAPSSSPTEPPTFNPTDNSWVHNAFMDVKYYSMQNLSFDNVTYIINEARQTVSSANYLELGISVPAKAIFQTELSHAFYDQQFTRDQFEVIFHNASFPDVSYAISYGSGEMDTFYELHFNVQVLFDREDIGFLRIQAKSDELLTDMRDRIRFKLFNDDIQFDITAGSDSINIQEVFTPEDNSDDLIAFLISWITFMVLLTIMAFASQKGAFKACRPAIADETQYFSILVLGIQVWDLVSDLYLSFEILDVYNEKKQRIFAYIFVASMFFSVFPYITNLVIAANIRRYDDVQKNIAATSWMNQRSALFVILTVVTGGSHAALAVLSSNVFGLEIFTTGLTKYELNRLQKIKIFSTIILENLPQIGIQFWYSDLIGEFSPTTRLAFSASILSVVATVLTSIVSREGNFKGAHPSYYISFGNPDGPRKSSIAGRKQSNVHGDVLQKIRKHRWQRNALTERLAKALQIPKTNLEIGYVFLTNQGCIIHIIHAVSDIQLDDLKSEINQNMWDKITAMFYVEQLYKLHQEDVTDVFQEHFHLDSPDIKEQQYIGYTAVWSKTYPKGVTKSKRNEMKKKQSKPMFKRQLSRNNAHTLDVIKELFLKSETGAVNTGDGDGTSGDTGHENSVLFNNFLKEKELDYLIKGNNNDNNKPERSFLSGMFRSRNEPSKQLEQLIEIQEMNKQLSGLDDEPNEMDKQITDLVFDMKINDDDNGFSDDDMKYEEQKTINYSVNTTVDQAMESQQIFKMEREETPEMKVEVSAVQHGNLIKPHKIGNLYVSPATPDTPDTPITPFDDNPKSKGNYLSVKSNQKNQPKLNVFKKAFKGIKINRKDKSKSKKPDTTVIIEEKDTNDNDGNNSNNIVMRAFNKFRKKTNNKKKYDFDHEPSYIAPQPPLSPSKHNSYNNNNIIVSNNEAGIVKANDNTEETKIEIILNDDNNNNNNENNDDRNKSFSKPKPRGRKKSKKSDADRLQKLKELAKKEEISNDIDPQYILQIYK